MSETPLIARVITHFEETKRLQEEAAVDAKRRIASLVDRKVTMSEIARGCGFSTSYVSKVCSGDILASLDFFAALSQWGPAK